MGVRTLAQLLLWTAEDYERRLKLPRVFNPLSRYLHQNGLRLPTAEELAACHGSFWVELGVPARRLRVRRCDLAELSLKVVLCPQPVAVLDPILHAISTVGSLGSFTATDIYGLWLHSLKEKQIAAGNNQPLIRNDHEQATQLTDLFTALLDQSGLAELGFSLGTSA
ncbi:MAG TPA: hypothetical protein VLI05_03405 [Candidatus Saccharimonadia bacterium]|nr:hypothetical protein [Candidatus Saccharimonadia bacterium]